MFTFTNQDDKPIMVQRFIDDNLFLLHPFDDKHTRIRSYRGDGIFSSIDCFHWIAEYNIPFQLQCIDSEIMRDAGWQLFFNICFYQVGASLYFIRRPNRMIISTLLTLHPEFKGFHFKQLTHFLEIENAVSHKLNDYIPLSYPIKFSTSEMLSYYFAKPSRLIYC